MRQENHTDAWYCLNLIGGLFFVFVVCFLGLFLGFFLHLALLLVFFGKSSGLRIEFQSRSQLQIFCDKKTI